MNDAPQPTAAGVVIVPLEELQVAEIRGLLRRSYAEGLPIMAEVLRNHTGVYLIVALLDRATGKKIQKLLTAADDTPAMCATRPP